MELVQAIAVLNSILGLIREMSDQTGTTSGARLMAFLNGLRDLSKQAQDILGIIRNVIDQERDELTEEEKDALDNADKAAREAQVRAIQSAEDAPTDAEQQEAIDAQRTARRGGKKKRSKSED